MTSTPPFPRLARAASLLLLVLLATSPLVAGQKISIADDPSTKKGSPSLVFLEFSDFQCPGCAGGAMELIPQIHEVFVETGQVEIVFLDNPLNNHPNARRAAQAGACAGEQGKFWEMHNEMFANQKELGPDQLPQRAEAAGLDLAAFQKCLAGHKHDGAIEEDIRTAKMLGINGTPGYVLARRLDGKGKVEVLEILSARTWEDVEAKIRSFLPPAPKAK